MADLEITEPGVWQIDEAAYHADPVKGGSLSQSGAKTLLKPGGPALFAWQREHPSPSTKAQELGSAAHLHVLGEGRELAEVAAENWRTSKAREAAAEARQAGKIPLLTHQVETVRAMAAKLREHDWASKLLGQAGQPETCAFWEDQAHGIWRRLRWDYMPEPDPRRRPLIPDYKSCASAAPGDFSKAIANYGYHQQADWYSAGYAAMFGDRIGDWPGFAFICQEKEPPYRVAVYELCATALKRGRQLNDRAMAIYALCTETGDWPGYEPDPQVIDIPYWAYLDEDKS